MIIERLMKIALLGSSWVLYLLFALSVFSISAIVERWWFFFRHRDDVDRLEADVNRLLLARDLDGAESRLASAAVRSRPASSGARFRGRTAARRRFPMRWRASSRTNARSSTRA